MRTLILGLVALLSAASAKAGESAFEFLERLGPHAVQTLVWYPAEPGSGKPVVYGDYLGLDATTLSFGRPRKAEGLKAWFAEGLKHADTEPVRSRRDATPENGRYPLVIYAASYDAPAWENADLCQYLASHGYVVISGPGLGPAREPDRQAGAEHQARDISFFIDYALRSLPSVDDSPSRGCSLPVRATSRISAVSKAAFPSRVARAC